MQGYIYVTNIRAGDVDPDETPIRIDRTSVFGNPYRVERRGDMSERLRVLALHEQYVNDELEKRGPLTEAITEMALRVNAGENIALQCWCAPLPCHGDHLVTVVMKIAHELRQNQVDNGPEKEKSSFSRPTCRSS